MRCNICYLPIHEETSKESCPRCFNDFHRDHFAAWLLDHDYCPMCRDTLSDAFREELRPKTESERKRLEQILSTLDGLGDMFQKLEGKERKRIMKARREEFGIGETTFMDIVKIAIPFILLGLFVFIVFIALNNA